MDEINPVMYIFANKSLGMSPGKLAAQVAHAACNALIISQKTNPAMVDDWYKFGFYTKILLEARDEQHLQNIQEYLAERSINSAIIIDEGRTEIPKHSVTALGVEIIDKNKLGPIFREFSLFKPELTIKVTWNY